MRFNPVQILTNGDMSADVASYGIDLNQHVLYSIQAVYTGTPTGTLKLQISNDIVKVGIGNDQAANVVNWTDYTNSPVFLTGTSGDFVWNVFDVGYRWVRLVYVHSAGTGTINATFSGKAM